MGVSGGSSHGAVPCRFERFLMMVDQYAGWVEYVALPSPTAEVTAKEAVDNFRIQMSVPSIQDQGSKFQNCMLPCGKRSRSINPGIHQTDLLGCNGQTENYNKLLMGAVVYFIGTSQN